MLTKYLANPFLVSSRILPVFWLRMNSITFNQDSTTCAITTDSGYSLYNINPFGSFYNSQTQVDVIELLYNTSLVAYSQKNQLTVKNIKRDSIIGEMQYKDVVKYINMNRQYLVVSADHLYIYGMNDLILINKIELTSTSLICLLDTHLVYTIKNVLILFNIQSLYPMYSITPHNHSITKMHANNEFIFTCSERGTIIRQYSIGNGELTKEYRRGLMGGNITDLNYHDYLVVSSENTVHFYTQNTSIGYSNAIVDTSYFHPTLKIKSAKIGYVDGKWLLFDMEGTLWTVLEQTVVDKKSITW
eukprot:NODE_596_length_6276_cov_0.384977.p2 type:complete len:302 gc:universal NODE_596_length_6276_cov_0.384977:4994-4089(-)